MSFIVLDIAVLKPEVVVGIMKEAASSGWFGDDQGALEVTDIVVERKYQYFKTSTHLPAL